MKQIIALSLLLGLIALGRAWAQETPEERAAFLAEQKAKEEAYYRLGRERAQQAAVWRKEEDAIQQREAVSQMAPYLQNAARMQYEFSRPEPLPEFQRPVFTNCNTYGRMVNCTSY